MTSYQPYSLIKTSTDNCTAHKHLCSPCYIANGEVTDHPRAWQFARAVDAIIRKQLCCVNEYIKAVWGIFTILLPEIHENSRVLLNTTVHVVLYIFCVFLVCNVCLIMQSESCNSGKRKEFSCVLCVDEVSINCCYFISKINSVQSQEDQLKRGGVGGEVEGNGVSACLCRSFMQYFVQRLRADWRFSR